MRRAVGRRWCSGTTGNDIKVREIVDKVYDSAIKDKYVVVTEEELEEKSIVGHEKKWNVLQDKVVGLTKDDMWKNWAVVEKTRKDYEILDVPEWASLATLYVRWKVVELRTRNDRFFAISQHMANHHKKRFHVYKNAYQSLRHKALSDDRSYFTPAPRDKITEEYPYFTYIHSRFKRDLLTMYQEDSFTRDARIRSRIDLRKRSEEYWKQDFHYYTKSEERWLGFKRLCSFSFYLVKLPTVFVFWRLTLITMEHCLLGVDYLIARRHGLRYAKGRPEHVQSSTQAHATDPQESLRQRIQNTEADNPFFTMLRATLVILFIAQLYFTFSEGRLPYYLVPFHERAFYMEMYNAYKYPEKVNAWVSGKTIPGESEW